MAALWILMLGVTVFMDVAAGLHLKTICSENVMFRSKNLPNYSMRVTYGGKGYIIATNPVTQKKLEEEDPNINMWALESPGLTGVSGTVSLAWKGKPGFYLRHINGLLQIDSKDAPANPDFFLKDATFIYKKDWVFPGYDAFQSSNYPRQFIRHQNFRLKLQTYDGSSLFKNDASFKKVLGKEQCEKVPAPV
ncbi:unnamed protein product [Owenia fusiformis]|uniref:Alpha-L-arabinofuranosidase B arabinose-binding domain-containing protein n=1 Tax=Owenia fusiformis TaxID=6347 RepID=A0A8S4Q6K5_OWEFU|nr:unnamed protein product [Owenia fusiformis]